jgi:hypothetical protein
MEDRARGDPELRRERLGACQCERADPDDETRTQMFQARRERRVACGVERLALCGGQLVGRAVLAALLEERERAVVHHEEVR